MVTINELQLSKDLIKFPSITPIDAGAINFLSKKLKKLGFKCKILEFKDKKANLSKIFTQESERVVQIFVTLAILMWFLLEI